jgi:holliday junction DNA helicase RuvA
MYAYISGEVVSISPAIVIIDIGGLGYELKISLHTFSIIQHKKSCKLFTYLNVKEDLLELFGFADETEKSLFVHLISVSGIGPNTARMVLSSFPPNEISAAIVNEDEDLIKSIKGIGPKTAKRLILELKDKLSKDFENIDLRQSLSNTLKEEALSALVMLGFAKAVADKAIKKSLHDNPDQKSVEELIKLALKNL